MTAETIRASEPGSTWEDNEGDIWEWEGGWLRNTKTGQIGGADWVNIHCGPLIRSTAAPRGDYGNTTTERTSQ